MFVWIFMILAGLEYAYGTSPPTDPTLMEPLFLTPYIEQCKYDEAKMKSKVALFETVAQVTAHSGFITVNRTYNSNIFFLFVVAEGNKTDAPVLLWTQGGPGLSALFGQFLQNGPISYDPLRNFTPRINTLQKNMNIIYLDLPVGAGFSFTNDPRGYSDSLEHINQHVMDFLMQFFTLFSEFTGDLYLAGESYGARYSVSIAHKMLTTTTNISQRLKGVIGGNGFLGPILYTADSSEFLYQVSMLNDQGRISFAKQFEKMRKLYTSIKNATDVIILLGELFSTIFTNSPPTLFQNLTSYNDHASPLYTERPQFMIACYLMLNNTPAIKVGLHAGVNTSFQYSNLLLQKMLASDWLVDITPMITNVLNQTRVLFYTGQLDALFPSVNQRKYFSSLNWTGAVEYRAAKRVPWVPYIGYYGAAGFMKKAVNFVEAVILGMSHFGAADKPDEAYYLITEFIGNYSSSKKTIQD